VKLMRIAVILAALVAAAAIIVVASRHDRSAALRLSHPKARCPPFLARDIPWDICHGGT
jgi:hypothetical protein